MNIMNEQDHKLQLPYVINIDNGHSDLPLGTEIKDPRTQPVGGDVNFTVIVNSDNVTIRNLKFTGKNAISLRINGDNCTLENLVFEDIRTAIVASGNNLRMKNITIRRFSQDGMRIASDGFYGENIRIEDLIQGEGDKAHHDAIQFYAGKPGTALRHKDRYSGQYALNKGTLKNVKIRSTTDPGRDDIGQLQGIFSADGFMDGLHLEDIDVETHDCIHGLSLRGVRTARDGTPSRFKNISVRQTPGIESKTVPQIRLTTARRLTETGRQQFGISKGNVTTSPLLLSEDESNMEEILFPPNWLRSGDLAVAKSINPFWETVPAGEFDELQQRIVLYEPCIDTTSAPVFLDIRA